MNKGRKLNPKAGFSPILHREIRQAAFEEQSGRSAEICRHQAEIITQRSSKRREVLMRKSNLGHRVSGCGGAGALFVKLKALLGFRANGRDVIKGCEVNQIQEEAVQYKALFEAK